MILSPDAQALQLEQGILGPASPIPSPCLLLKNMFNPSECALFPPHHHASDQTKLTCVVKAALRCKACTCGEAALPF